MADLALLASHAAFSMTSLSAAIQKAPYVPQLLGQMNIFTPDRSRTTTIAVEEKGGVLSLIPVSERGAPLDEGKGEQRNIKYFTTNRIARGKTLYAHELQNIRAFGETSELQGVQNQIAEMMNGTAGLRAAVELTHEHMRLGAVQGKVMDAAGNELHDWFAQFGIARPDTINFDFAAATAEEGQIRVKCNQVIRAMMRGSQGAWLPGMTRAVALCGDKFYDDLLKPVALTCSSKAPANCAMTWARRLAAFATATLTSSTTVAPTTRAPWPSMTMSASFSLWAHRMHSRWASRPRSSCHL